jgi:hypothetical protein
MKEELRSMKSEPLANYVISITGDFEDFNKEELIEMCEKFGA